MKWMFFFICIGELHVAYIQAQCDSFRQCANSSLNSRSGALECQGVESCELSNSFGSEIECGGLFACDRATLGNSVVYCQAFGVCNLANVTYDANYIHCVGTLSCTNSTVALAGLESVKGMFCGALHSCLNSIFMSPSSTVTLNDGAEVIKVNGDTIYISGRGVFSFYNSTIYSNGNDLNIWMRGYYDGYGLIIYCNSGDNCHVYCYANGCAGLTLICSTRYSRSDFTSCGIQCLDMYCPFYHHYVYYSDTYDNDYNNYNNNTQIEVINVIDSLIDNYAKNFSIYPINSNININGYNWINMKYNYYSNDSRSCELIALDGSEYTSSNELNVNGSICCLAAVGCSHGTFSTLHSGFNMYCTGTWACWESRIVNVTSIYVQGDKSAMSATMINFQNMISCESSSSCLGSIIQNGPMVVCEGDYSCSLSTITNVTTVIGIGVFAFRNSVIDNATHIYLLGHESALNLTIINSPKCTIYCHDGGCSNSSTTIYCKNSDISNYNVSKLDECRLVSLSPTAAPTKVPTISRFDSDVAQLMKIFNDATIIIAGGLVVMALILTIISYKLEKKHMRKRLKSTKRYLKLVSETRDDKLNKQIPINSCDLVDYQHGFGKNASHLIIFQFAIEIYDIYTDICYSLELKTKNFQLSFIIFIISLLLTFVVNIIIFVHFWKNELKINISFRQWFYQRSGMISCICFVCLLTDFSLISGIFTSHIFGHSLFYAPMTMNGIQMVQISRIISIFIEHLPQLWVEFYVIFYQSKNFTNVMISALIVSLLDVGFIFTKSIIWCVSRQVQSKN